MEAASPVEAEARPRKNKTKGILKNGGGSHDETADSGKKERKQKERRSEPRRVEIRIEPEKKHKHRRHKESSHRDSSHRDSSHRESGKRDSNHRDSGSRTSSHGDSNIYDTPKVSSVKWQEELTAAAELARAARKREAATVAALNTAIIPGNGDDMTFYENLSFADMMGEKAGEHHLTEQVYDIPRPQQQTEAIYFNRGFEEERPTYDTPRRKAGDTVAADDHIECEYDVPKAGREGLLTPIEEEVGGEYDIPRSKRILGEAENIYENQTYTQADMEPIYMNELSDGDRSSGYRSSPSIHSEENLFGNQSPSLHEEETLLGGTTTISYSLEDLGVQDVQDEVPLERHDVAIETTHTLEKEYNRRNQARRNNNNNNRKKKEEQQQQSQQQSQQHDRLEIEFEEFNPEDSLQRSQVANFRPLTAGPLDTRNKTKKIHRQENEEERAGPVADRLTPVVKSAPHAAIDGGGRPADGGRRGVGKEEEEEGPTATHTNGRSRVRETVDRFMQRFERAESEVTHPQNRKDSGTVVVQEGERSREIWTSISTSTSNINNNNNNQTINISKLVSTSTSSKAARSKSSAKDLDRSVDVYHETVRQRTVRDKPHLLPDLFQRTKGSPSPETTNVTKTSILTKTSPTSAGPEKFSKRMDREEVEEPGLPSVRKLLARFEPGRSPTQADFSAGAARPVVANAPRRSGSIVSNSSPFLAGDDERPKWKALSAENIRDQVDEKRLREPIQPLEPLLSPPLVYQNGRSTNPEQPAQFDPQLFVKSLYNLPAIEENPLMVEDEGPVSLDDSQSTSCPSIEGYMEKLPPGRKRPTLWNSWKRHYFVAKGGILYIYTNKLRTELIEKLELFGGQVDFMDSNMLGLEDRRGQYIVVRCASHKAAQEWESALSFHTLENYSKTFISPVPIPKDPRSLTNVVVVDLGGASVRAGLCGPQPCLPHLFFPSLMAVNPDNQHDKVFGFDALRPEIRSRYTLSSPLLPSRKVDKYSVDLVALCGLLLKVFQDLRVDPKRTELQLSVPRNFNDKTKVAIAALLFDEFGVKSVNMGHQAVFALHSYSATTGVVIDIGERMDIVPIVAGYRVQAGICRTATGGLELTGHMRHALLGRNYSLTSTLDTFMVRQVVERLCYLARNYDQELEGYGGEEKSVQLAAGSRIPYVTLGAERFHIAEGIFRPELWGLDQEGIHLLVKRAVTEVSLDVRKEVAQSIFLSGGLTLIPGFKHRLEVELAKLLSVRPRVHASPYRYHAAYLGACSHATSPAYASSRVTREQWIAGKADVVKAWVL